MRKMLLILYAIAIFTSVATAEELSSCSSNEGFLSSLYERLNKNDKQIAKLEKLNKHFRINGFLQGIYEWNDASQGNTSIGTSSFSIYRARLIIGGDIWRTKEGGLLDYWVYADLSFLPKSPFLALQLRYQHSKQFNIVVGHMQNPIHFEEQFRPTKFEFIDFAYATSRLLKMGSNDVTTKDVPLREMGIRLYGGFLQRNGYSILNYSVGFLNHIGILTPNTNKSGDLFCRLFAMPSRYLTLALHYQYGEANFSKVKQNSPTIYADYRWKGNPEYMMMQRWGGGFTYITDSIFTRCEYVAGITGTLPSESCYIEGGYKWQLPKNSGTIWAGSMIDYFCYNCFDYIHRNTIDAAIDMRYTICIGYQPIKDFHIQVAYSLEQRLNYTFANSNLFGNSIKFLTTLSF